MAIGWTVDSSLQQSQFTISHVVIKSLHDWGREKYTHQSFNPLLQTLLWARTCFTVFQQIWNIEAIWPKGSERWNQLWLQTVCVLLFSFSSIILMLMFWNSQEWWQCHAAAMSMQTVDGSLSLASIEQVMHVAAMVILWGKFYWVFINGLDRGRIHWYTCVRVISKILFTFNCVIVSWRLLVPVMFSKC